MQALYRFNAFIEKHMIFVAPCCLVLGIVTSRWTSHLSFLVNFLFLELTFEGSLGTNLKALRHVAAHPLSLLMVLVLLHIIMPLIAFAAGNLLFPGQTEIITGMVIEALIPAAIVSLTWSSIYHGNAALSLSIVVVDTLLAPFIMPPILKLFLGSSVTISAGEMIGEMFLLIGVPAVAAMVCNQITHDGAMREWKPRLKPFSKICMIAIITINSTKLTPYILAMTPMRVAVAFVIWGIIFAGFGLSALLARILRCGREDRVSVLFGGGMRNISAGAVIAVTFFPGEAIFPVMMATLFQQFTAGLISKVLWKRQEAA